MLITTTFNNTDQEIKDFFTSHLLIRQKSKYIYIAFVAIFLIIGILFFFVWKVELFAVFLWIVGFFWGLYWPFSIKRIVKKIVNEGSLKTPPQRLILTDKDIKRQIDKFIQTYSWDQILFVVSNKKYMYFYISKNGALICNKKDLSDAQIKEIETVVTSKKIKIKKF